MNTPCLIVGAGPTGLMAALLLQRAGITCRIIEQKTEATKTSNAIAVQARTLEIWHELGFAHTALERGIKLEQCVIYANDKALLAVDFTHLPSAFPFILSLPQSETEALLEEEFTKLGGKVERGKKLVTLQEEENAVRATLESGEQIIAGFVLGCDGYHSSVRDLINADYVGGDLAEHFIMMDAPLKSSLSENQLHIFFAPPGALMIIPMKGRVRVLAEIGHDPKFKDLKTPGLEDFQAIAAERTGLVLDFGTPWWQSSFWVHERITTHYRHGRVFLAGDAAHVHSPAGGQGMNTGLQDVYSLVEKLIAVIRGEQADSYLDAYESERRPVAKKILRGSTILTHMASLKNPCLTSLRDYFLTWLNHQAWATEKIAKTISEISQRE